MNIPRGFKRVSGLRPLTPEDLILWGQWLEMLYAVDDACDEVLP